jgi:hypothetical protein
MQQTRGCRPSRTSLVSEIRAFRALMSIDSIKLLQSHFTIGDVCAVCDCPLLIACGGSGARVTTRPQAYPAGPIFFAMAKRQAADD